MTTDPAYLKALDAWRAERIARLTAEDGWLNLVGRWWLEPGAATVGSGEDNDIVLPVGPAHVGTITKGSDGGVTFQAAETGAAPVRLKLDKKKPPRFSAGRLLLEVMSVNDQNALRVRDREAPSRRNFAGISSFPVDPSWRIVADWTRLPQPVTATVDTMIGTPVEVTITHEASFTRDGVRYRLLPTHGTPESPQFVIRDLTSRGETYPASRFLFGEDLTDSTIVLDFNKAINPPCAFTDHAICPLPPPENILPIRIEAGELKTKA